MTHSPPPAVQNRPTSWRDMQTTPSPWKVPCPPLSLLERLTQRPQEPWADLLEISLSDCAHILEHRNPRNRTLGESRKAYLTDVMRSGLWQVNGETVIFGANGHLLDGQGRLAAAVMAELPLKTWVVFGIDPAAFEVIDRGKKRGTADDLSIEGEENVNTLAAALNLLYLDQCGQLRSAGQSGQVPSQRARHLLEEHPAIRNSVSIGRTCSKVLTPSIGAYCHYKLAQIHPEQADQFFMDLRTGAELAVADPVLLLRNRLLNGRAANERLPERDAIALVFKAWNMRRQGRQIKMIQFKSSESIPDPI